MLTDDELREWTAVSTLPLRAQLARELLAARKLIETYLLVDGPLCLDDKCARCNAIREWQATK